MPLNPDPFKQIEELTKQVHDLVEKRGGGAFRRYPLTLALLTAFGLASVVYGFEKMVDKISLFQQHPFILLIIGVSILLFTGGLYKQLNK